jgi:hypothetical protein
MRYIIKILTFLLCFIALTSPVAAIITNISNDSGVDLLSNSYLHDAHYMPAMYVYAMAIIGILCLAISRLLEAAEDIFAIGATIPIAVSAWFANFMSLDKSTVVVTGTNITVVDTQIVSPNPYLSLTMTVFFILAIVNIIWIFYLRQTDKKISGE